MSSKQTPPSVLKRPSKNRSSQEMEPSPSAEEISPPIKKKILKTKVNYTSIFETATTEASSEIVEMFTNLAEALCEKATSDSFRIQELEGILHQARDLEAHLKEKKERLKHKLALISDKLSSQEG